MTRYGAYIALIGASVTIILNVLLVPRFSYLGAAWGHFGTYLVMVVLSFFLGQRFYRIDYPLGRIAFYFGFAIALFLASYYSPIQDSLIMGSIRAVFLMLYILVAYLLERKSFKAVTDQSNSL
jgi:O-antigen/teichoic acid export membrane protein